MNLETKITIYKFTPQVFTLPQLYKSDLLKFHWIAENFYRFLSYCGLDIAKHDAHFKLKTGFSIKYICKPLETKNKPIGRLI